MAKELVNRGYSNLDYFDNFFDQKIDLSKYLTRFSTEEYNLKFSNLQPVTVTIKNLFEQSKIIQDYRIKVTTFTKYRIQDKEKLEDISYNLYDTVDFWWIIAVFNDIKNPFYDLPLSEEQIVVLAQTLKEREGKYPEAVYYKLIAADNEERREILAPKREQISNIVWSFRQDRLERIKIRS